jgi:formylglycine-generating enzyme required for sulfatase activity
MPPFRLSKTEVTVGDYKAFLRETGDPTYKRLPNFPENKKGDDYPVVGLTLGEKIQFARYYGATLPTAAQIEYASKGSRHTDLYGTPIDKAVIWDNGYRMTAEVCGAYDKVTGRYERENDFGVCDLAGNVWETTSDGYDENFYDRMNKTDPRNLFIENRANYVELRGASFYNFARPARAANRFRGRPVLRYFYVGFHLAWPPDSKQ